MALSNYSPGGKVVAAAGADGIRIWDVESGNQLRQLALDRVATVVFSPDGKLLASSVTTGTSAAIHLWDADTGKEVRAWATPPNSAGRLTFSPDGKTLASAGGGDHAIRRWDIATGKERSPSNEHTGGISSLVFTTDGKSLFSLGHDRRTRDLATSRQRPGLFRGPLAPIVEGWSWMEGDLSPDGTVAAGVRMEHSSGGKPDFDIHLWSTVTGQELTRLTGHKKKVLWAKFASDGKLLGSIGEDGLRLWNWPTAKELRHLEGTRFAFSPDARSVAIARSDGDIHLLDVASGNEIRHWASGQVIWLVFSPDGRWLASNNEQDSRVWRVDSGTEQAHFAATRGFFDSIAFSPSGRIVAASPLSGPVQLWEVISGQEIRTIDTEQGRLYSLSFAPDGRTFATGGSDSTIVLWDLGALARAGKSKPARLTASDLGGLWSALADDASKADRALWTLVSAPAASLPFLKKRLAPVAPADDKEVAKLVNELDSDTFATRQRALQRLAELGESAEAALRKALEGNVTLETRSRLQQLLKKREVDSLRKLRAIGALELIGTEEALQLLDRLSKGTTHSSTEPAAGAALQRLVKRRGLMR